MDWSNNYNFEMKTVGYPIVCTNLLSFRVTKSLFSILKKNLNYISFFNLNFL